MKATDDNDPLLPRTHLASFRPIPRDSPSIDNLVGPADQYHLPLHNLRRLLELLLPVDHHYLIEGPEEVKGPTYMTEGPAIMTCDREGTGVRECQG